MNTFNFNTNLVGKKCEFSGVNIQHDVEKKGTIVLIKSETEGFILYIALNNGKVIKKKLDENVTILDYLNSEDDEMS